MSPYLLAQITSSDYIATSSSSKPDFRLMMQSSRGCKRGPLQPRFARASAAEDRESWKGRAWS